MAKITFIKNGESKTVDAICGESLLQTAKRTGIDLFGGCDGAGVCGSCNVLIDDAFLNKLNTPSDDELDLIDIVSSGKNNCRLACQTIVNDDLDGMVVTIP